MWEKTPGKLQILRGDVMPRADLTRWWMAKAIPQGRNCRTETVFLVLPEPYSVGPRANCGFARGFGKRWKKVLGWFRGNR